jgi:hypothetical protein
MLERGARKEATNVRNVDLTTATPRRASHAGIEAAAARPITAHTGARKSAAATGSARWAEPRLGLTVLSLMLVTLSNCQFLHRLASRT